MEVPTGGDEAILEAAFYATNRDDRPLGNVVCATSAGDIMKVAGQSFLVEGVGFHPISEAQRSAIINLTSRDTSMGLDWLIRNGKVAA